MYVNIMDSAELRSSVLGQNLGQLYKAKNKLKVV